MHTFDCYETGALCFFFFSSRRRHTRLQGDWSSDVCSSDLTVTGSGMLGVPGIAARTFAAVHHEGISVSLISQASSEHSICFSVPEGSAERARRSLETTFQREIARQEIDGVEVRTGAATLVVVGLGMAGTPGDRKSTRLNSSHLVISYAVF